MLDQVSRFLERHRLLSEGDRVLVAVSGGPDSLCLLHLLRQLRDHYHLTLHVAHLDHQLRPESADDADFVRRLAAEWGLPFTIKAQDVHALAAERKLGIEEAARVARYDFLNRVAGDLGAGRIALGHNADDQAETVLMHLLRGAGLAGLRGMSPSLATLQPGLSLIRPLLEISRTAIEKHCQDHGLRPRLDQSNLDTTLFRNRLRHEVLPYLDGIAPGVAGRLRQLASLAAADFAMLQSLLDETWASLLVDQSAQAVTLDLSRWRELPLALRRLALRRAVETLRHSLRDLSFEHVEAARRIAETAETGAESSLPGRLGLMISYDQLIIADQGYAPSPPADWPLLANADSVPLKIPGRTPLPNSDWALVARLRPADSNTLAAARANRDEWCAWLDAEVAQGDLVLRPRRPGERFQPLGMKGKSALLSKFMINERIPMAWRDRLPLVARPDHLLWLAGWRLDARARVTEKTMQVLYLSFARLRPGE